MDRAKLFIILASGSPRRSMLLEREGYRFCVVPSKADELDAQHHDIHEIVVENARRKGLEVLRRFQDATMPVARKHLVLAADTLVVRGETVYGKPRDLAEAARFLRELGGVPHQVLTGVWLGEFSLDGQPEACHSFLETTTVTLKKLDQHQIHSLFERVTPLDKAAGYGFQDAPEIVESLEGSTTNVYGLPMERLEQELCSWLGDKSSTTTAVKDRF